MQSRRRPTGPVLQLASASAIRHWQRLPYHIPRSSKNTDEVTTLVSDRAQYCLLDQWTLVDSCNSCVARCSGHDPASWLTAAAPPAGDVTRNSN